MWRRVKQKYCPSEILSRNNTYNNQETHSRTRLPLQGQTTYLIEQRPPTKVKPNKPETNVPEVHDNGKRKYLSSLYPTSTVGRYRMEKGGTWYLVDLAPDVASITFQPPSETR